ncbi:hypothetical protein HCH_01312 [Hahella chejuensis KCTC 2396]|uniref:Uncharacterized protein n=1 Tax=Hahella chejuensis (strain KCTC 2396) TaxID=349521 RepID=Q2SME5_HAHCH|nr:hypothetical protein HCH_01312 [Hahella chejuensis KCTC 2396]
MQALSLQTNGRKLFVCLINSSITRSSCVFRAARFFVCGGAPITQGKEAAELLG